MLIQDQFGSESSDMILILYNKYFFLFIESPFNNIHEAFKLHPKFKIWKCLPGPLADWFFTKRLTDETAGFVSDQIIDQVSVPILFLHAKGPSINYVVSKSEIFDPLPPPCHLFY